MSYPKLIKVEPQDDFILFLQYENGELRKYDFSEDLNHPFFERLKDPALFKECNVIAGNLEWTTGEDFCPFTLYEKSSLISKN